MQTRKIFKKLITFVTTIALTISLLPITAYATEDYNGDEHGNEGVHSGYINGASASKQFIRMYVTEPEHGAAITQAVDVVMGSLPSSFITAQGLRSDLQITRITPNITSVTRYSNDLGIPTPFKYSGGSFIANGANLKEWMMSDSGDGSLNIEDVIKYYFGEEVLDMFKDTTSEKVLVIEPGWWHGIYDGREYLGDTYYGTAKDWVQMQEYLGLANGGVMKDLDNTVGQTCLILARPILGINTEYPVYSNITHDIFADHGYGLHTFSNQLGGQTTCDEPQQPTPHASAQESSGKCKIVKTYRIKDSNNNYEDKGTYVREEVDGNIQIENENGWNVVGWASSRTFNSNPGYNPWAPPQELGTGKVAQNVKVPTGGTLYVLLEKVEEDEEELGDYDYIISQSRITKKISMSAPVSSNGTLQGITDKEFKWSIAAHPECQGHSCHGCSCPGHYETCGACGGSGGTDEAPCGSCGGSGEVEVENTERCYFFA